MGRAATQCDTWQGVTITRQGVTMAFWLLVCFMLYLEDKQWLVTTQDTIDQNQGYPQSEDDLLTENI